MEEVFDQIEMSERLEKRVAMATLVATRGTSPKKRRLEDVGEPTGRILGSVTIGGCADAQVIEESEKRSRLLNHDYSPSNWAKRTPGKADSPAPEQSRSWSNPWT